MMNEETTGFLLDIMFTLINLFLKNDTFELVIGVLVNWLQTSYTYIHTSKYIYIICIRNTTPRSGNTDLCIRDFFNRHDFMKHWVEVMFCYNGWLSWANHMNLFHSFCESLLLYSCNRRVQEAKFFFFCYAFFFLCLY